jgi:Pyruvate/2-oxoacid:ferredoxin oxidoreductase gamma subunit
LPLVAGAAGGGVELAGFWALAAPAKNTVAATKITGPRNCMGPSYSALIIPLGAGALYCNTGSVK